MKEKRFITSRDVPGGTVYGHLYDEIRERNDNPNFVEEKPYTFIKNIKTSTKVHGWLFVFANKFFVATYHTYHNYTSCVSIYDSNKKGDFNCVKPIDWFPYYCDIETAVDKFCAANAHLLKEIEE